MRLLVLSIAVLFSGAVQAADLGFVCETSKDLTTDLGDIRVFVEGKISGEGESREMIYRGEFSLGCNEEWGGGPDDCWASTPEKYGKVKNQVPYRPRVYIDHRKFSLDLDSDNSFGSYDFIFPKEKLIEGKTRFTAHMILTYINDHFGTSVSLNCYRKIGFKLPDNYVDIRQCYKTVMEMKSIVNICGDDSTFSAWGCDQKKLGEPITCRAVTSSPGRGCVMDVTMGPMCKKNLSTSITRDERDLEE